MHHKDKYFSHAIPFGLFSCVSIASQRLNWKINSNLNYWNKEHQESEIKWLCSLRSFLIGKLFLQGILMVLRKDCKTKLIGWGRLIANVLFFTAQQPPIFMTASIICEKRHDSKSLDTCSCSVSLSLPEKSNCICYSNIFITLWLAF